MRKANYLTSKGFYIQSKLTEMTLQRRKLQKSTGFT